MLSANTLLIISTVCIWILLCINILLIIAGYIYYLKTEHATVHLVNKDYPFVSVLVPAHNEAVVITQTVKSLLSFNYPSDRYEVIVINDNSSDNSSELLENLKLNYPTRQLIIINTNARNGGKGKSNALNIGLKKSKGALIAVYDADNTPEQNALLYLVSELVQDERLGAAIGKFRTRNRLTNLLTRFINIETLSHQWMSQAGRWQLFKLCTIPGTNFIIHRRILEKIGGWDTNALAEDTELSFRIYMEGYLIKFQPKAVTWEQEPETLLVWFRQRTRWVKGNIYVIVKNTALLFNVKTKKIRFDIFYYIAIYFLLVLALVTSDLLLVLNFSGYVQTTVAGISSMLWLIAILLFITGTFITVTTESDEMTMKNVAIIALMYLTYCQMWLVVAAYGLIMYFIDSIFKRERKWYKTERFK
ncbi:glycosyltransferase family 2 protein [Sporolactobacillus sp. CPB3-1]|uniref:Glycosyltransferase family 2 protein n=1 Tax=Sporolactobacillus mangiferae TaxID=2940498 RepID=A0ABT0M758_9BACL|nr:glycosyltransferase family 2 protein [Sporolactobacillus mangiferae]MCL1630478.1 glycosyltransferase family 2 protein [Sporolactobacillus mangiferae]